jgi:hypothetical protein
MSNRHFRSSSVFSMEKDVKQLFAHVTFGATGAPTLDAANSKGVASITRSSAGKYVVTMGTPASSQAATADKYKKLLIAKHVFDASGNSGTAPAAPGMYVVSQAAATAGTVTIQFNAAGTATDPASGEAVWLQFIFGDSTV